MCLNEQCVDSGAQAVKYLENISRRRHGVTAPRSIFAKL